MEFSFCLMNSISQTWIHTFFTRFSLQNCVTFIIIIIIMIIVVVVVVFNTRGNDSITLSIILNNCK